MPSRQIFVLYRTSGVAYDHAILCHVYMENMQQQKIPYLDSMAQPEIFFKVGVAPGELTRQNLWGKAQNSFQLTTLGPSNGAEKVSHISKLDAQMKNVPYICNASST